MLFKTLTRTAALCGVMAVSLTAGAAQFVIGQVAPMTGLESAQARAYSVGIQMALAKAGTINGHTLSLVSKDDKNQPAETVAATKLLLSESRPLALAGYFGDRGLGELVASGVLEKENIALVGYRINDIRKEAPFVYSVRANLRDEVTKIIEHLATVGINRLGLFYEDGPAAAALLAATEEVAKGKSVKLTAKGSYAAGTLKVTDEAMAPFMSAQPQAIIIVASGSAAAAFIEKYRLNGGAAQLFAHSGADIEQMSKRLGEDQMKGVSITQVTPNPYKVSGLLAKEFNDIIAKKGNGDVPVSYAMMEGYIAGSVIAETMRRMGPKVSREAFVKTLETMDSYDLGGYKIGYKPDMHSGSRFVELTIITAAGRIRQ